MLGISAFVSIYARQLSPSMEGEVLVDKIPLKAALMVGNEALTGINELVKTISWDSDGTVSPMKEEFVRTTGGLGPE